MRDAKSNSGIGNRRTPRRVFSRKVGVLYRGEFEVVKGAQISEGGMMLYLPWHIPKNDSILVTLILPGGASIVVRATILYSNKTKSSAEAIAYGMKFTNLGIAPRRLIRNYVSMKTEEEAEVETDSFAAAVG